MKLTPPMVALIEREPLMKCANRIEFQHRLQWLSEGVLRNHMKNIYPYTISESEIENYLKYKQEST